MSAYQNDSIENCYNEIKEIESLIIESGAKMKTLADREAIAAATYEEKKNALLIQLFADETKPGFVGKRTEAQRIAIYRSAFSQERLERGLASAALKAERDYQSALQSALMAKQSRLRVLEAERNFKL